MTATEDRIKALFEELVPAIGKADTVAGEIVRAINRISYRNYNDGDHVGVDYGNKTCNPAARYLMKNTDADVAQAVSNLWGVRDNDHYDMLLDWLEQEVLDFLEVHSELRMTANTEDMWSYYVPEEDRDWDEDEEW